MATKLARETRAYVRVTLERTLIQHRDIGVLVEDPKQAGEVVLALDKVQRDAGWHTVEKTEPKVSNLDHQEGVFDSAEGRLIPAR